MIGEVPERARYDGLSHDRRFPERSFTALLHCPVDWWTGGGIVCACRKGSKEDPKAKVTPVCDPPARRRATGCPILHGSRAATLYSDPGS